MDTKLGGSRRSRPPSLALYEKARTGDRNAVDELYGRYLPRLLRWAEARVGPSQRELTDTDAVVRRVLLETLQKKAPASKDRGGFLGEARQAIGARLASDLKGRGPDESPDAYEDAFGQLELGDQDLIAARLEDGVTYEEIALEQGLASADEARKQVGEAILRLAERMRLGSRR